MAAIEELSAEVDRAEIIASVEQAAALAASRSTGLSLRARLDAEKGHLVCYAVKRVAKEVQDPETEVGVEAAPDEFSPGDLVEVEVPFGTAARSAARAAGAVLEARLGAARMLSRAERFRDRVGKLETAIVARREGQDLIVNLGPVEGRLPAEEQSRHEVFNPEETIRVAVHSIEPDDPPVILSRIAPAVLAGLIERETPEVRRGVVQVRAVARHPGIRAKVAVSSAVPGVDPVAACLGPGGSRIRAVSRELRGERVDVVLWDQRMERFARNALRPAEVLDISTVDEESEGGGSRRLREKGGLLVTVSEAELPRTLGKRGQNVRLASELLGVDIEVVAEGEAQEADERRARRDAVAADSPRRGPRDSDSPRRGPRDSEYPRRGPRDSESPRRGPRDSDSPRRGPRDSEYPRRGPRDSEYPRRGPRDSEYPRRGPRDSEYPRRGPRDSESPRRGPRDSEYPRRGPRDSEYPRRGPRDSEYPRRGPRDSEYPRRGPRDRSIPGVVRAIRSRPGVVRAIRSIPGVVPAIRSRPGVVPAIRSRPGVVPAIRSIPGVVPAIVSIPGVVPAIVSIPGVVPAIASIPGVVPAIRALPGVVPAIASIPGVVRAIRSRPGVVLAIASIPGVVRAIRSRPGVVLAIASIPVVVRAIRSRPGVVLAIASIPGVFPAIASIPVVVPAIVRFPGVVPAIRGLPGGVPTSGGENLARPRGTTDLGDPRDPGITNHIPSGMIGRIG